MVALAAIVGSYAVRNAAPAQTAGVVWMDAIVNVRLNVQGRNAAMTTAVESAVFAAACRLARQGNAYLAARGMTATRGQRILPDTLANGLTWRWLKTATGTRPLL